MDESEFLIKLGLQIAKLRKKYNITQLELAYRCDMEKQSITRIEKGNTNPTSITLLKISEALEVKISDLFAFQGKK